jgi:ABC-type transport system involved in cytochrome c biogenesis permease subunit
MTADGTAFFGLSYAALLIATFAYGVQALRPAPSVASAASADEGGGQFFGLVGMGASVAAALTLFAGLAWRIIQAAEFSLAADLLCLALAFATIVNHLIVELFTKERKGGSGPALLALLLQTVALFVVPAVVPHPAPLGEPWFTLHTVITLWAYGLLAVAAGYGLAALWPATPQELHEGQSLSMALGVVVLSLGLIVGGWWSWSTGGSYLPASARLSWELIVWLIYTAILGRNSSLTSISRKTLFLPVLGLVPVAIALWAMAAG